MKTRCFEKRTRIEAPADVVFRWHEREGALERLCPPWDPVAVIRREGGVRKGGRAQLRIHAGPIPMRWEARHTDYEEGRYFRDEQVSGPFSKWVHHHRFIPDGENACILEDRIEYALPAGFAGDLFLAGEIEGRLSRIFAYRHRITAHDVPLHLASAEKKLSILVTGASGVVGSALVPFLTTGGHRVIRLVRRRSDRNAQDEVFWDPVAGVLDPRDLPKIDAVVHLAGENIGEDRWTPEKKREIVRSRKEGTGLLARVIGALDPPPKVMVAASAIGFYGDRGEKVMTEADGPGEDFISHVCHEWEEAAIVAQQNGIRVASARIGVALTPRGGALAKVLPLFRMGLGGCLGSGRQYISWISMEDVVGAIWHLICDGQTAGPVNLVSPSPVTNRVYSETLARVLSRPAIFNVPEFAIKRAFGEMGREIVLSSTRVRPEVLLRSGYRFRQENLSEALSGMLGLGQNGIVK